MRIIKEGRKLITMNVVCPKCDAELEIETKDLKKSKGIPTTFIYNCPWCNHSNSLKYDDLPKAMIVEID